MRIVFNTFLAILALVVPSIAYGPFEIRKFEYYVSQSPSRVSYSSFTFYEGVTQTSTECKYKAPRSYNVDESSSPLPTNFTVCSNPDVKWKYQVEGQIISVEFGYWAAPIEGYEKGPIHPLRKKWNF
ncbi:hypothetical protein AOL_s00043g255 [Orbilia oligospora ATCC 24927]|uniref:AA1-like domain-containing protein n=2 Tax=Orbilia oligospora TaxID=2813651 RepID=G1X3I2_ARTOA|nr:hypothetical protein AOL_s00043g255 [Orbilia oligospora ATCC 24927]EGX52466.1 hypothetical protein AOL_s00043g255 [Orbilia oligospora ATCC 24927]KAF3289341.1 hypothetical protein TWF970_003121 [Orbilia oligospora]